MSSFSLADMLKAAGARMASELSDRFVPHRGEQGAAREAVVRDFLRSYLPARFEVSTGFVFDAHGAASDQLDIIVADSMVAPRFEVAGGVRFYPCEAVVAVGQVRTHCDSKRKVWDAFENLRSAAELDRSAGGRALCDRSGAPIDHTRDHLDRVFTFLFVIDKCIKSEAMAKLVLDYAQRNSEHVWPSLVLSLGKHLTTYACDDGACPNTMHARGISSMLEEDGNNTLLQFYVYLSQALASTRVARMSSWHHLGRAASVNGDIYYSATDDPPPFLASLVGGFPPGFPYDDEDDEDGGAPG
jgi:hypothetical protein